MVFCEIINIRFGSTGCLAWQSEREIRANGRLEGGRMSASSTFAPIFALKA